MTQLRVLAPPTARSALTLANGTTIAQVPGTLLDTADYIAEYLISNGWIRAGTVGSTASRPSSNPNSGTYSAQAGSQHVDTSLGIVVIHDGTTWRSPLTGAVA